MSRSVSPRSFVAVVRSGEVAQPSHPARFDSQSWADTFSACEPHTKRDVTLFKAGSWFAERFKTVAAAAQQLKVGQDVRAELVRLQCGVANELTLALMADTARRLAMRGALSIPMLIQGDPIDNDISSPVSIDDMLEGIIDGLRIALDALRLETEGRAASTTTDQADALYMHLFHGAIYRTLVTLWNETLWNDWRVYPSEELDFVVPPTTDWERARVLSRYRYGSILFEVSTSYGRALRQSPEVRERLESVQLVKINVDAAGHRLVFKRASSVATLTKYVAREQAEQLYFFGFLDIPLPRHPRITLNMLLDTWGYLAAVGDCLIKQLAAPSEGPRSVERLRSAGLYVTGRELRHIVSKGLNCGGSLAAELLSFFLLEEGSREEVWHRPFVRADEDSYVPVIGAVRSSNPLRSLQHWARLGKLELDRRGGAFEQFAREEVRKALVSRRTREIVAGVLEHSFRLATGNHEQVDLVMWFGRHLLIGELKCSFFPDSPYDWHRHGENLRKAARQAKRKAEAVRDELLAVTERIEGLQGRTTSLNVVPLVLVNSAAGAGTPVDGVAVVDLRIVRLYFTQGYLERFVEVAPDGGRKVGEVVPFYDSAATAETNLPTYLLSPPQVSSLERFLTWAPRPIVSASAVERRAAATYLTVQIPG